MNRISVCIATHNGEKFIYKQLKSILSQLTIHDEVIISDDSSTDNTITILESLNDPRIKIFKNQRFYNPIFNFENAIKNAKNEIIFLADQDDLWVAGKVDMMVKKLTEFDVVVCDHQLIDEEGNLVRNSYFDKVPYKYGILNNLLRNSYFGCCMAFRRKILSKALPFPKHIPMHDIWLGFVCSLYYKTLFLPIAYTQYRRHSNNLSTASEIKSSHSIFTKLKFRYNLLRYIPRLIFRRR